MKRNPQSIRRDSEEVLRVGDNTLYPALHRLEARGDLSGARGRTSTGREARIYTLTAVPRQGDNSSPSWPDFQDWQAGSSA